MAVFPGDVLVIRYAAAGPVVWHERLVLCRDPMHPGSYGVLSPDGEVEIEEIRAGNQNLRGFKRSAHLSAIQAGITRASLYDFSVPFAFDENEITTHVHDACFQCGAAVPELPLFVRDVNGPVFPTAVDPRVAAAALPGPLGVPGAVGVVPPIAGVPPIVPPAALPVGGAAAVLPDAVPLPFVTGVVPPLGIWVLDEPTADHDIGQPFQPPAGFYQLPGVDRTIVPYRNDGITLKWLPGNCDVAEYVAARMSFLNINRRTMDVPAREDGKTIAQLINSMDVIPGGLPAGMDGVVTAPWFCDCVAQTGSGFVQRHHRWRAESGVGHLPVVYEHECAATFFDLAIGVDRLNIKNLVCMEYLLRRKQHIESVVLDNPTAPSFDGARFFMGKGSRRGGALIAPNLQQHVAAEYGKEAAIQKERRKAFESRQKGGKAGKGNGGGSPAVVT